jgi:hypothetical protein
MSKGALFVCQDGFQTGRGADEVLEARMMNYEASIWQSLRYVRAAPAYVSRIVGSGEFLISFVSESMSE